MEKKVTITDIAKAAGVSKTTISRYLNGYFEYMSAETKDTIEEIIRKYNYSPNNLARGLKSKKSGLIGIVVNTLQYQVAALFVRGINDVCVQSGYGTIISCSDNLPDREEEALRMCESQQVDGIALIPTRVDCADYHRIHEGGTPIVMCNRYRADWKFDGVYVDNVKLTRQALEHMWQSGYRQIAMLTDNRLPESNKRLREEAFISFSQKFCGAKGRELLYIVEQSPELVRQAIISLMETYPDEPKAVLAINTNTLFLTLREIKRLNLRIPEDIAVCGYDLLGWSEIVSPGITSLDQPFYDLGVAAGQQLIRRIVHPTTFDQEELWFDGSMNIRESTRPVCKGESSI